MASPQAFDPLFDEPRDAKMYTGLKGRTYLGPTVKRDTIARCELPGYPHGSQASGSGIGEVGKAVYGPIEAQRRAGMSQNELQLPFDPNNPLTPRLLGRDMSPRSACKRAPDADGQGGSASEDGRTTEEMAEELWSDQGNASPMYLGATGEIYDCLYEPIPKSMRMRTDLDSNPAKFLEQQQNTRTFEIAPFPMPEHDHSSYFEWEQEVLVWKDRTERQMRGLRPVSMSGRHLYRPRQNRPHSLGERKPSQDVILSSTPDQPITSLPNSDTGSAGEGKYHSSSSPMRSLNSAGPLNPHEDESSDAEHPTWDAILIPAEPNPVHYHTFEDYSLAMTRWAVLVQRLSAKIAPAPRQLPALLQLTNHAIIPPRPFSETNPLRYSANGTAMYRRHTSHLQASTESSEEDYEDDDENEFGDELGDRSRSGLLHDRLRSSADTGEDGESSSDVATQRMKLKRRSALFDPAAISNLASPANSNPNIIGYDKRKSLKIARLPLTLISQGSGWWDSDSSIGSPQGKQSPDPTDPGYHVFTPQMRSVRSPGRTTPRSRPSTRRFATPHTSLLPGRPGLSTHSHPSNTIDTPHRSPAPSSPLEPLPPLIPKSARGNLMPSSENSTETLSARGQPSEHLRKAQNFSAKHSGYIMSDKMKSRIQRQLVDLLQRQQQRYHNTGRFGADPIRGVEKRPFSANPATGNHSIYPEINYKQLMTATVAAKKSMAEAHRTTLWLAHPSRSFELDVPFIHLSPLGPRHLAANQTSPVSLPMLSTWVEDLVTRPRESSRTTSSNSTMWIALQEAIGNVHIDPKSHPNGSAVHTLSLLDVPSFISLLATDFSTTTSEGASEKSPRKTNLISLFAVWLFPTVRRAKPEPLSPRSSSVQSDSASMSKRTIRSNKTSRTRHLQMVLKLAQDIQQPKALFKLSYLLYLSIAARPRQSSEIFAILFESVAQAAPKPDNEFGEPLSHMPQQSGEERLSDDESLSVLPGGRHRSGSTSSAATGDVPVLSFSGISLSSGGSDMSSASTTSSGEAYEEALHSALFLLNFGRSVPIDYYTWYKSQLPSFPDFSTASSPKPDSASSKDSTMVGWEIKDTATRLAASIERAYQCQLLARCVMEGLLPSYIPPTPSGGSSKTSSFSSAANSQTKLTSSLPFPFAVQESPNIFSRRLFECWRTEVSLCFTILTKNLKDEMIPEEEATSSSNDSDAFHDATKTMPGLPSETARLVRFLLSRTGLGSRSRLVSSLSHFVVSWILQFDSHLNFWRDVCQIDISREISPPSPTSAASSKPSGPHIMVSSESMDGDASTVPSLDFEPDERLASSTASSATFSRSATNTSTRPSRAGISSYPAQFRTLLQRPSVKFVELVNHALKSKLIHVKMLAANIVELCMHHDAYQSAPPTASRGSRQQPQPWVQLWATRLGGVAILDGLTHGLPSRSSIPGYGSMGTSNPSSTNMSNSSSSLGGIISPRALSTRNSSDFLTFLNPSQAEVSELTKRRLTSPPLASVSSEVWHAIFWKVCGPSLALVEATTPATQFIAGKTQMSAAPQWLHPHPPMDQSHALLDHLMFGCEKTDGTTYLLGASTNPNQVRWSWEGAQGVPGVSPPPLPMLHTSNSGSSLSGSSSGSNVSPSQHTPSPPGPSDMAIMHPFSYLDQAMMNDLPLASLRDANLFHRTLGRLLKAEPGAHSQILASSLILVAGSLRRHALIVPKATPGSAVPGTRSEVSGQSVPLSIDHVLRLLVYVTTPVSNALHGGERASIFRVRTSCIKLLQLLLTTPPIMNWLTSNVNLPLITTTPAFSFVPGSSHSITSPTNQSGFLSASGILERSGSASSFASNSGMVSPVTAGRRRKPWGITGSTDPSGGSNDHLSTVHSPGSNTTNSSPGSPFDLDLPKGEAASAIRKDSMLSEKDFGSTPSSLENALLPLLSANSSPPTTPRAIPSSSVPSPQQSQPGSIEADSILKNAGSSSVSSFSSLSALRLAYGGAPPTANSTPASSLGSTSPLTSGTSGEVPAIPTLPMPNLTVESSAAVWLAMVEGLIAVIRFGTDLSSSVAASECLRSVIFARPMIMEVFLKPLPVQVPNIFAAMLQKKDAKKGTPTTLSVEDLILQARQSGARAHSSIASANASGASTGATVSSSVSNYTTPSSWLLCAAPSPLGTSGLTWAVPTLEASLPVFLRLHACLSVGQSQSATTTLFSHLVDGLNASHSLNNVAHCLYALNQLFSGPVVPLPSPSYLSSSSTSTNAANASIQATLSTKSFKTMLTYFVTHHLFIKVHLVYKRLLEDEFIKVLLEPHTIISQSPVNPGTPVRNLAKSTPLDPTPGTPPSHSHTTEPESDSIERKSTGNRSGFLSGLFGKKVLSQSSSIPSSPSSSSMPSSSAQVAQPTTPSMPSTPPSSKPSPTSAARGSASNHQSNAPIVRQSFGLDANGIPTALRPPVVLNAAPGAHLALMQLACLYHTLSTSQACHKVMKAAKGNIEFMDGIRILSRFYSSKLASESASREFPTHGRPFSLSKPTPMN